MIWPSSTPYEFNLPFEEPEDETGNRILDIEVSKPGYYTAVITRKSVFVVRPKPFCPVAVYHRSAQSLENYGGNQSVFIRPDGQILGVSTEKNSVLIFHVTSPSNAAEIAVFNTEAVVIPGPGEGIGVREIHIHFRMVVKVDSGIAHSLALEDNLMLVTQDPPAIQMIKWTKDNNDEYPTETTLLSSLDWLKREELIVHLARSRAMMLLSFVTSSGNVYTAGIESNFQGHIVHSAEEAGHDGSALNSAINARFSLVAVGCQKGSIYLYNIRDFHGSVQLVRKIEPPSTSLGSIQVLKWSSDGYALFVGYENGWALFSVYGLLNASSFLSSQEQKQRESWLDGVVDASWSFSGDLIFMIPSDRRKLWGLKILRWSACGNYTNENLQRPVLFTDTKLMLYRGQDQGDLTTIDRDALLWLNVNIPASYISENWPIKYVSSSKDGRYIAVSGVRGLTHYSLHSGRWKLFSDDYMDREFTVRGGLLWYGHILIAAVDTEQSHEIRMYSRELDLDPQLVLYSHEFPAAVLKIFLLDDLLLVYTFDNILSFFQIHHDSKLQSVSLDPIYEIGLSGIVHSPARVRALSCFPDRSKKDKFARLATCSLLILVDGMLVLLQPNTTSEQQVSYNKHVLHNHIEYYTLTSDENGTANVLWAFDGRDMLIWLHDITLNQGNEKPTVFPVEAYPLAVMIDKGIIMGVESNTVLPREAIFTYFKHSTSTQLFVPFVLEAHLRQNQAEKALQVAREYQDLKYFAHILEMLLYRILDSESGSNGDKKLLAKTTNLLSQFAQMLDVVLGCTRKTELSYWRGLFDVLGSPQELFERCIQLNQLKIAGGYLLVLHNLEKSENTEQNTERLFKIAYDAGDSDLCKELARFLTAIDPSGSTLRKTLDSINLSSLYKN
jgi:hypothetical protein